MAVTEPLDDIRRRPGFMLDTDDKADAVSRGKPRFNDQAVAYTCFHDGLLTFGVRIQSPATGTGRQGVSLDPG